MPVTPALRCVSAAKPGQLSESADGQHRACHQKSGPDEKKGRQSTHGEKREKPPHGGEKRDQNEQAVRFQGTIRRHPNFRLTMRRTVDPRTHGLRPTAPFFQSE
jgi:hypothetical protein